MIILVGSTMLAVCGQVAIGSVRARGRHRVADRDAQTQLIGDLPTSVEPVGWVTRATLSGPQMRGEIQALRAVKPRCRAGPRPAKRERS